jgi:hypothetical protein
MPFKDPEKARANARDRSSRWRVNNLDEVRARQRARRADNPGKARMAWQVWIEKYPAKYAYNAHKCSAKKRGIPFLLTFDEWWTIWDASGNWEQRGRGRDEFCMARVKDKGAYVVGNVSICTHADNAREAGEMRRGRPLSELAHAARFAAAQKAWATRRHRGKTL